MGQKQDVKSVISIPSAPGGCGAAATPTPYPHTPPPPLSTLPRLHPTPRTPPPRLAYLELLAPLVVDLRVELLQAVHPSTDE